MHDLVKNIRRIDITDMAIDRVKKNIETETEIDDVIGWAKAQILDKNAVIERAGKNWYVTANGYKITVNASTYTIITAHRIESE